MRILFLGDIVGNVGCNAIKSNISNIIKTKNIDFVIVNGENSYSSGVGITENIANELFSCGIDVITTGNHVWDQKETFEYIQKEKRLLRPKNMSKDLPGNGFGIFLSKNGFKIGVLNLIGNVYMKKSDDVFQISKEFLSKYKLREHYDFLIVDFHGEITSEKMAIGHFFDGMATMVVGTHTHVPTNDSRILNNGTAYQTDAGMCGDYNSVIGMNKEYSLNKFLKINFGKKKPSEGEASICGVVVEADIETGLAKKVDSFIYGGELNKK